MYGSPIFISIERLYYLFAVPVNAVEVSGNTATPCELQTLIIECSVTAYPPATFEWIGSRGGEILNNSRVSINTSNEFTSTAEPTSTSILTIKNVTVADDGDYICIAINNVSSTPVFSSFTVTVIGELK